MPAQEANGSSSSRDGRLLISIAVTIGIALFIIGFVMTVMSLSDDSVVSAGSAEEFRLTDSKLVPSQDGTLFLGFVLSMAGLVTATTVPAVHFLRSSKNRL
jgi:hypothetical protein